MIEHKAIEPEDTTPADRPTVTDEMVETAAQAMWERIDREESWPEIYHAPAYRRDARAALEAVAPLIAAAALRQFADSVRMPWTVFLREDGSPVTVGDLLRERATSLEATGKEDA